MTGNLLKSRYDQLVNVFTAFYMNHPDAEVYTPEYRVVLAKCEASKAAYKVTYGEDIERTLKRLNEWRSSVREQVSD